MYGHPTIIPRYNLPLSRGKSIFVEMKNSMHEWNGNVPSMEWLEEEEIVLSQIVFSFFCFVICLFQCVLLLPSNLHPSICNYMCIKRNHCLHNIFQVRSFFFNVIFYHFKPLHNVIFCKEF